MAPEDLQLLVTREMPFGKYKGRLIADLLGNYPGPSAELPPCAFGSTTG